MNNINTLADDLAATLEQTEGHVVPVRIGRRNFLRRASLTAGGLGAGALLPLVHPVAARAAESSAAAPVALT